jgi:DNA-binding NtrC family response regulator
MNERLLIVEDEETLCQSLKRVLEREGYTVNTVNNAESAHEIFETEFYDVIITDIILPGMTGIELLKKIKERLPEQIVIIMTAYASLETAVEALRYGAYDYVVKPVMHEEIKQIVKNALKQGALQDENVLLKSQIEKHYDFNRIIGGSPAMRKVMDRVKGIADADNNVLLIGEMGTGKELIARAIHFNSARAGRPFIPVNFNAVPEEIMESRLFGYVKGAFEGAAASKKGLFEEASGGTLFIREIGDLKPGLQSKLLSALRDCEIMPVGGVRHIRVDLRFISATYRDIEAVESSVKRVGLNADLFRQMSGVSITLPPLRERKEDIEPLTRHFIQKFSHEFCKAVHDIEPAALDILREYRWPGNIKELQNIIERAVLISDDAVIRPGDLPPLPRSE